MKFLKYFVPVVFSLLAAIYSAEAQIVNPAMPAAGVPLAGTGINVAGQTVSVNYGLASQTYTGTVSYSKLAATAAITGSTNIGPIGYGTLSFSDTNVFSSFQTSVNSYAQSIWQNTNAGATASTNLIVANDQGTATTHFGEFGINSSAFTGTGSLNIAGATYLDATTGDLVLGTTTANAMHFVVNSGATDAMTISGAGVISGPGLDNYVAGRPVVQTVLNVAALRTTSCVPGSLYQTQGYTTAADNGSGIYLCNGSDTTSTDNSFTIIAAANSYRFYLQNVINGYLAKQGGAKGDGTTNDLPALQNEVYVLCGSTGSAPGTGGGRLVLGPGKFRITGTLNVCNGIVLDGQYSGGYPYVGATSVTSQIIADFGSTITQWAIDSLTFASTAGGGARIAYNAYVDGNIDGTAADGFNSTHDVAIKNINLVDANGTLQTNVPFGGIRLVGCPNALIENVTVFGFGVGMQLNTSFGTKLKNINIQSNYYGVVAYNANNNFSVEGEVDKIITPASLTVPVANVPSWMPSVASFTGSSFNMDGSHYQSAKGIIVGAAQAVGTNLAVINGTFEYWPDVAFLYNSYATDFQSLYAEDTRVAYVLATAYASFTVEQLHNFTNTSTYVIDAGYQSVGDINVSANNTSTTFAQHVWGSVAASDPTYIMVHDYNNTNGYYNPSATSVPFAGNQRFNKMYEQGAWTPTVACSTGTITTATVNSATYTKVGRSNTVNIDFTDTTNGTCAGSFVVTGLPYTIASGTYSGNGGGKEIVTTNKALTVFGNYAANSMIITFYDSTFPGATGSRIVASLTYQN